MAIAMDTISKAIIHALTLKAITPVKITEIKGQAIIRTFVAIYDQFKKQMNSIIKPPPSNKPKKKTRERKMPQARHFATRK